MNAAHRPEGDLRRAGDEAAARNFDVLALTGGPDLVDASGRSALRRSAFSSSWISRLRSPFRLTEPTSGSVSRSCLIRFSAISRRVSFGARGPYIAKVRIGDASGSIFWICGGLVSRGNCPTTVAILSRTSWVADSMSRSSVKRDADARIALIGRRPQLVDAADRVDGFLDPLGDLRLDLFGARAGQVDC